MNLVLISNILNFDMRYLCRMRLPYLREIVSLLRDSLDTLNRTDRRKFFLSICALSMLSVLDLVGVASIAGIAMVGSSAVQGENIPQNVSQYLSYFGLNNLSVTQIAAILGISSAAIMSTKSILSLRLNRRVLNFLAIRETQFANNLIERLFKLPFLKINQKSSGEYINIITHSVNSLVSGALGYLSFIVVDFAVLLVMTIALFSTDPITCLFTLGYFGLLTFISSMLTRKKSKQLSKLQVKTNIEIHSRINDAINGYKEAKSNNRLDKLVLGITENRSTLPYISIQQMQLTLIPKYFLEIGLIVGVILVSAIQFFRTDSTNSVTVLAVFFLASSRITPSLLRLQNTFLLLIQARPAADPCLETLRIIEFFEKKSRKVAPTEVSTPKDFDIKIENISLTYPGKSYPALKDISLDIPSGTSLGIIGRSGSGKTTLVDIILGLISPDSGAVTIGGYPAESIAGTDSGKFAYVPQTTYIKSASIRENIAFGISSNEIDNARVWTVIEQAGLRDFVESLDDGIEHQLGERGIFISGGQRQRINIARALYSNPRVLVLDEATSALDIETEAQINSVINNLHEVTRIVIAHRLTSVRNLDQIALLSSGKLIAIGKYEQLLQNNDEFRKINDAFFKDFS